MNDESLTRWLHNPLKTDHTIYYRRRDGVAVEHMLRPGSFDMARRHFHPEYEIYLLLHGRRQIYYENRAYLLEEGSLALIDSSRIHMTCPAEDDPSHYYERIILYLDREKVEEYDRLFPDLGMRDFFHRHDGVYLPSSVERKRMTDMLETVMRELSSEQDRSRIAIDLAILQFFVGFWRTSCRSAHQRDEAARTKKGKFGIAHGVSEYLSVHFCEEIPLEKLAEAFHVSGSYLSRSFKDAVGVGIREYINILRIRKAQQMLEDSTLSVSEIAQAVGFESASYFGQVFQKHLAISPSRYRKDLNLRGGEGADTINS